MTGIFHAPQFLFEVRQFITEPGGEFELQLGRGVPHLLAQLFDQLDQVLRRSSLHTVSQKLGFGL